MMPRKPGAESWLPRARHTVMPSWFSFETQSIQHAEWHSRHRVRFTALLTKRSILISLSTRSYDSASGHLVNLLRLTCWRTKWGTTFRSFSELKARCFRRKKRTHGKQTNIPKGLNCRQTALPGFGGTQPNNGTC